MESKKKSRGINKASRQRRTGPSQQKIRRGYNQLGQELRESNFQAYSHAQLIQELEGTKQQLQKQKFLKEMYINRGKETKRDLERLIKYSSADCLSTVKIAEQVRNNNRQKKKKVLHTDYEELQVAHIISQEKFNTELQTEVENNQLLKEEFDKIKVSHQESNQRCESEVTKSRNQAENLFQELEKEIQQKKILLKYYEDLQEVHIQSQDKFAAELQEERERNRLLQEELEAMKLSHQEDRLQHETEVFSVRQRADGLQRQLEREIQLKTRVQKELEELQVNLLQQEVENLKVSHQEISQRFETEALPIRQQVETLQSQLDKETQSHAATIAEGWTVINKLRTEKEALCQQMADERNVMQEDALEKQGAFESQLKELKTQLSAQVSFNLELSIKLEAEREQDSRPPRKRARREEEHKDVPLPTASAVIPLNEPEVYEEMQWKQQESTSGAPALEVQAVAETSEDNLSETQRTTSVWKRTRHFLGLRKPDKWKQQK